MRNDRGQPTKQVSALAIIYEGRSGSVFIQSLLDGHPEILSIPATSLSDFYNFWDKIKDGTIESQLEKILDHYNILFDCREDTTNCGLNRLGESQNESVEVDRSRFKQVLEKYLEENGHSRRNILSGMYIAWNTLVFGSVENRRLLVYPLHVPTDETRIRGFREDFPDAEILISTRNPLSSYGSLFRHHYYRLIGEIASGERTFDAMSQVMEISSEITVQALLSRIITGKYFPHNRVAVIKLEELHGQGAELMRKVAEWLEVSYGGILEQSTFGGKTWWNLPGRPKAKGFSDHIDKDKSATKYYYWYDKEIWRIMLFSRMKRDGYVEEKESPGTLVRLLHIPLVFLPDRKETAAFVCFVQIVRKVMLDSDFRRKFAAEVHHYVQRKSKKRFNLFLLCGMGLGRGVELIVRAYCKRVVLQMRFLMNEKVNLEPGYTVIGRQE